MIELGRKPLNGKDGLHGNDGLDGKDGSFIHVGPKKPDDDLGKDGDLFLDNELFDVYYKKFSTWLFQGNIKGPRGKKGDKGDDGKDGQDGKNGLDGRSLGHFSSGGSGGIIEEIAVTLTANVWQTITPAIVKLIEDFEVYDDTARERVELDLKINTLKTQIELRSKVTKTFTLFVEGK